jgi:hypothetical protein
VSAFFCLALFVFGIILATLLSFPCPLHWSPYKRGYIMQIVRFHYGIKSGWSSKYLKRKGWNVSRGVMWVWENIGLSVKWPPVGHMAKDEVRREVFVN